MGVLCLPIGVGAFVFSDLQIGAFVGGFWFLSLPWWKLIHTPTLVIDREGVRKYHPFSRWEVKWDEIDAI